MDDARQAIDLEAADEAAREQAVRLEQSCIVQAPAGSGKTSLLVDRALCALAEVELPEEVVALTFTNKAANEMQTRISEALAGAASGGGELQPRTRRLAEAVLRRNEALGWGLLENPGRLRVMTLDALAAQLTGAAPVVSGLGAGVQVDDQPQRLYQAAAKALIADIDTMDADARDRAAVLRVLAFVKNREESFAELLSDMLAKREQWLGIAAQASQPEALDELTDALESVVLGLLAQRVQAVQSAPWAVTLRELLRAAHAAGLLDSEHWPAADDAGLAQWRALAGVALTKEGKLRSRLTRAEGFAKDHAATPAAKAALADLAADGEEVAALLRAIADMPEAAGLSDSAELVSDIACVLMLASAHLSVVFHREGAVDFQEIGMRAIQAVRGNEGGATALAASLDCAMRHVLVDEAQDTSVAQYQLIEALICGWTPGDGRSLFIVGDPQQSIYRFRQADVRLFMALWDSQRLGDIDLTPLRLTRNFRSGRAIVDWCNSVFASVFPGANDAFAGKVRHEPSVAAKDFDGAVDLEWYSGRPEMDEARRLVERVRSQLAERPGERIGVLVRARSHVRRVIASLREAGIRVTCTDIDPLSETDAVRDVVALIRALWHPADVVSWAALLRAPFVGLDWADLVALRRHAGRAPLLEGLRLACVDGGEISEAGRQRIARLMGVLDGVGASAELRGNLADMAEAAWRSLGGAECVGPAERDDVARTLLLLREHLHGGQLEDITRFNRALSRLYASASAGDVEVMTVHKAKGLQFDSVFLVGFWREPPRADVPLLAYQRSDHGLLIAPYANKTAPASHRALYQLTRELDAEAGEGEAQRLAYVAATRAERLLVIFCATETLKDGAAGAPPAGSLLSIMWPGLMGHAARATPTQATPVPPPTVEAVPSRLRLPADWQASAVASIVPPVVRTLRPSESVVRERLGVDDRESDVTDRVVGTLYHEAIDRICRGGQSTTQQLDAMDGSLTAAARRAGVPEPRVTEAVARVMDLLKRTLEGESGRWIVAPRDSAGSEYRVAGFLDGAWVSGVIDRWFIDTDGTAHLIDYKATGASISDAGWAGFVRHERALYAAQLEAYARVLQDILGCAVKSHLYFPARDALESI